MSEGLRDLVKLQLYSGLDNTNSPSDFAMLSSALFDADKASMQSWIGDVLSGRNPKLQKRVLTSLIPDLGLESSKPFLPTLTKVLADSHADNNLRAQCALAIAKLKPMADSELLNAIASARNENDDNLKTAVTWVSCELGRYEELGLIKIPAGEFLMGSSGEDSQAVGNEKPQHTVYLPTYYIAKHPVTVDQYRAFVKASGYKTTRESSLNGMGNHPVVYVDWKDALAYARWSGLTLPSEAEWEKAARGTDGRIYPWGNEWQNESANTREYLERPQTFWDRLQRKKNERYTTPVGSFPHGDSPYGCADMAGNVWEWTYSIFKEYPYDPNDGREDESASGLRVFRGGSFFSHGSYARCASRGDDLIVNLFGSGFRVCASPVLS